MLSLICLCTSSMVSIPIVSANPLTPNPAPTRNAETISSNTIFPSHAGAAAMPCPLMEAMHPPVSICPLPPSKRRNT